MGNVNQSQYTAVDRAYDYMNEQLFGNKLGKVAIVLHRKSSAYGYFQAKRWHNTENKSDTLPEISLNPDTFDDRSDLDTLSTLAHEMVHQWQYEFGTPGRGTYHNKEFASKMAEIGLICSNTGMPGGKQTGQKMTHYIDPSGKFYSLISVWVQDKIFHWGSQAESVRSGKSTPVSKVKYACPNCEDFNVWAKPGMSGRICCAECSEITSSDRGETTLVYLIAEE